MSREARSKPPEMEALAETAVWPARNEPPEVSRTLPAIRRGKRVDNARADGHTAKAGAEMATHRYTIILEREPDGGFHAFCPALKGCHSQGDSLDEALDNIREAIEAYLESVEAHGEPIPREDLLFKPVEVAL